jgi:[ribosomal protein S18]-alanine N-acetyltransferase
VRIRSYRPTDLDCLYQIDQTCFEPDIAYSHSELAFYVRDPRSTVKVAEETGEIVGFVLGRVEHDSLAHVITLDVVSEARRKGVGTRLMRVMHREFLRRNAEISVLEVSAENKSARRFYERLQYRYACILPGYYAGRIDAFRMFCHLKQK